MFDDGAFPGHVGSERAHFVERHIGRVADAAFAGTARNRVLHAIAGEHFDAPVIQLNGNVDGDFAPGVFEDLAHPVVQIQLLCRIVETHFGREPGILLLARGGA